MSSRTCDYRAQGGSCRRDAREVLDELADGVVL